MSKIQSPVNSNVVLEIRHPGPKIVYELIVPETIAILAVTNPPHQVSNVWVVSLPTARGLSTIKLPS